MYVSQKEKQKHVLKMEIQTTDNGANINKSTPTLDMLWYTHFIQQQKKLYLNTNTEH